MAGPEPISPGIGGTASSCIDKELLIFKPWSDRPHFSDSVASGGGGGAGLDRVEDRREDLLHVPAPTAGWRCTDRIASGFRPLVKCTPYCRTLRPKATAPIRRVSSGSTLSLASSNRRAAHGGRAGRTGREPQPCQSRHVQRPLDRRRHAIDVEQRVGKLGQLGQPVPGRAAACACRASCST